jgi:outer membrane beta-barrel protein
MESRIFSVLLSAAAVLLPWVPTQAAERVPDVPQEQVIEPALERRVYTEADIDTEDFEIGVFAGVLSVEDFGSDLVYGIRAAYHVTEDFFVEAAYGRSELGKTSFENLSGAVQLLTDDQRDYSYYNLSLAYNVLPGEAFVGRNRAFNTALYLIGGVGSTDFAGDNLFTVNVGVGYRFLVSDFLALRVEVRDHIFDTDLLGEDKTTHNLEAQAGLSMFF